MLVSEPVALGTQTSEGWEQADGVGISKGHIPKASFTSMYWKNCKLELTVAVGRSFCCQGEGALIDVTYTDIGSK